MADSPRTDAERAEATRVEVYRARHAVEAGHARSWLVGKGIDDVDVIDRVFRGDADAPPSAYDQSGYLLLVPPGNAKAAKRLFDEARERGLRFDAEPEDLGGLA